MITNGTVLSALENGVLRLTLNRLDKINFFNPANIEPDQRLYGRNHSFPREMHGIVHGTVR